MPKQDCKRGSTFIDIGDFTPSGETFQMWAPNGLGTGIFTALQVFIQFNVSHMFLWNYL